MKLIAEFSISGLPELPNKNRYKHWAIKRKDTAKWKQAVYLACKHLRIDGLGLNSAVLTFTRHSSREPDFDNLVSSFKACQDGLVFANVIQDDKQINVGQPAYIWKKVPNGDGFIMIRIETKEESSAV